MGSCLPFNEAEEDNQPGQEQAEGQVQLDISQVTQGLQERKWKVWASKSIGSDPGFFKPVN